MSNQRKCIDLFHWIFSSHLIISILSCHITFTKTGAGECFFMQDLENPHKLFVLR